MKNRFNQKKLYSLFVYSFYLICIIPFLNISKNLEYDNWFIFIFWFTIFHFIFTFTFLKSIRIELFSISGVFIFISYIFHLGQIVLKIIAPNYNYSFDISNFMTETIYKEAIIFSLITISFVSLGVMMSAIIDLKKREESDTVISNKTIVNIGWIILICTFPIEFYYSIIKIIVGIKKGYTEVLGVESIGILSQIARFHLIGVGLLIMGYSKSPRKSTIIFLVYTLYGIFTMLSGSRIYQLVSIVLLMYIFLKSTKIKFSVRKIVILGVFGFFLMVFLNAITEIRSGNSRDIAFLWTALSESFNNNPIYATLEEFGGTLYTVCLTVLQVPNSVNYSHGLQFITNFVSVLPNINGLFSEVNRNSNFVLYLDTKAIGGSYIAELYYSFNYASYLAATIIGFVVGFSSNRFKLFLDQGRFYAAAYYIMPFFSLLIWVRGSSGVFIRNSLWGAVFIFIVCRVFVKKNRRKN
ncbi:hypothetical protein NEOCIP111885_00280 [Pseudoneobacillus rhizosphaerae]|uniref:O-antigen polysaccharide polymerase Wzy n=2 Tax=Pseudoneobacillus rhizosphaerae TaxID=2880968 RepID=A0A9C7G6U3_9BACI|nr:O-antigen polysaccharide polymerase Wzy [Pseudoneobacillus rhizosphaerae]CAG9606592.1 hypothetical protein NEOCIP111885_00280 [Pseudoneobacillus rhizosphaerae]